MDTDKNIGGTVYELILQQVIKNGMRDIVSGDIYITRKCLRQQVLGIRCRIPDYAQVHVIRELLHLELLVEEKSIPNCVLVYNNAETFYKVKKEVSERLKKNGF